MKIKVILLLAGLKSKASSRVRGFWLADKLMRQSIDVSIIAGRKKINFLSCFLRIPFIQVVYFQKRSTSLDYLLLKFCQLLNVATIYDIDDSPGGLNGSQEFNVQRMMRAATVVTVGSENLKNYAEKYCRNVYKIPSGVDLEQYQIKKHESKEVLCLGWVGHGGVYGKDIMQILFEPLSEIARKYHFRLKLVGVSHEMEACSKISSIENIEVECISQVNWEDQSEINQATKEFDIGLYPLKDEAYNHYKCGFKALEYMALGIPVIASPVGENVTILKNNVDGYLASCSEEWVRFIGQLMESKKRRVSMGNSGRGSVSKYYSTDITARALARVINDCIS